MQIRLYKTADNPRKLAKSYTPDQTLARTFENVDAAVFENGSEYNISALKLDFEAKQAGEGDPSPDNVRPITGHTQATVNLRSGNDFRAVFKPFGDTYYSGIYDAVTGILTYTWAAVDLGTLTWTTAGSGRHSADITGAKPSPNNTQTEAFCTIYRAASADRVSSSDFRFCLGINNNARIQINDSRYNGEPANDFKNHMNGIYICYPLNSAQTASIGALPGLNLFPGENRLWATDMIINQLSLSVKSGSALITTDNGTEYSNVQFISENDRKNPVLRVVTDTDLTAYNYAYISYYDRFYFVKVRNIAQGVYSLECNVDLLMTCKSDLLKLNCTIKRNAESGSPYLYDELYHTQMYKLWAAKEFPQGLTNESFVLMTVGTKTTP